MPTVEAFHLFSSLLSEGAFLVAPGGEVVAVNQQGADLLDMQRAELIGSNLLLLVSNRDQVESSLLRCQRSSGSVPVALEVDGRERLTGWGALVETEDESADDAPMVFLRVGQVEGSRRFVPLHQGADDLDDEVRFRATVEGRLRRQEEVLAEQLTLAGFVRDVAMAVSQESELEEMLEACTLAMVQHLGAAFARVWTADKERGTLQLRASSGLTTHLDGDHSEVPFGQHEIGSIAEAQLPVHTNAVVGDPNIHDQEWAREAGLVGFAGFPLLVDGRTLGVIAMFSRNPLSEATVSAVAGIAGAVAMGIHRKNIEADLRSSVAALQRADLRRNEFVAMLAHELRGPLAPIRHSIELLKRGAPLQRSLPVLDRQLDHVVRLVDDLLDASRVSRGQIALRRHRVALRSVIDDAVESVVPLLEPRSQAFSLDISLGDAAVIGDHFRLRQVLVNLLQNAVKYTPDNGCIELGAKRHDGVAEIWVKDSGIGVEPDQQFEIFDLFAQSSRGLDRQEGGLGLGLTLARNIVLAHGGEIGVESEGGGRGSRFWLRLPTTSKTSETAMEVVAGADRSDDEDDTRAVRSLGLALNQARILVVDDNERTAETLATLLELMGCQDIDVAYDGEEALRMAAARDYQVCVSDIGLPKLDGYGLARAMREMPKHRSTLIIALSGYGGADDRLKSREAGFDAHLVKPVDIDALEGLITSSPERAGTD